MSDKRATSTSRISQPCYLVHSPNEPHVGLEIEGRISLHIGKGGYLYLAERCAPFIHWPLPTAVYVFRQVPGIRTIGFTRVVLYYEKFGPRV